MSAASPAKTTRRQIVAEFKERKIAQGIFAIRCSTTNQVWVGASPNLNAARNSNWFQLRSGLHRCKSLQATWTQYGEASFLFEVVEQFSSDIAELNLRDHMSSKKTEWVAALSAQAL